MKRMLEVTKQPSISALQAVIDDISNEYHLELEMAHEDSNGNNYTSAHSNYASGLLDAIIRLRPIVSDGSDIGDGEQDE